MNQFCPNVFTYQQLSNLLTVALVEFDGVVREYDDDAVVFYKGNECIMSFLFWVDEAGNKRFKGFVFREHPVVSTSLWGTDIISYYFPVVN